MDSDSLMISELTSVRDQLRQLIFKLKQLAPTFPEEHRIKLLNIIMEEERKVNR